MSASFSRARIVTDIASVTDYPADELKDDTVLTDIGLDSLRMMELIEDWRADGASVDYYELVTHPTLGEWVTLLSGGDQQ
ncbi:phosphopantetheine-binding protein [Corynebacterium bovis]|uniref:phosphopantetheine-binding protein n=1 Tax=Corynebacterium bovis TaxID=36808 RepID=UPI00254DBF1B|nr:phosphopantetheine-binding protein [Corynebacterium bovis]MDK8511309.1 phosphopantetheine-binding protein [Corynebacterium bovis]